MTWVASDQSGAFSAVGLGQFDIEERHDRSPWVLGMIFRRDPRGAGIGRLLLAHLETWAYRQGYEQHLRTSGFFIGSMRNTVPVSISRSQSAPCPR
jgi:GNAT superfamily N-acetyltransferase